MHPQDKARVRAEVLQRVLDRWAGSPTAAEDALLETIYHERRRLESEKDKTRCRREQVFYDELQRRLVQANGDRRRLLAEVIERFIDEVMGHFDQRVYRLATAVVPAGLSLLLNSVTPLRLLETLQGSSPLLDQLIISGETVALQKLSQKGTLILVSTHSSNLDSILLGYAIYRLGLPPFTYGAGLNLFENRLIGFFMHHLGAYKVDRRKQAPVYKDVLKTYAGYTMELGYHNMFFPGGTRCRSGRVEDRLKLGLLGMGLDAYIHNLKNDRRPADVFVVPCTLNYQLVLEAETLIEDHLKETGKSRFIIDDDEFSKPRRIFEWVRQIFSLHSTIHLVVGQPLDVFGNRVDEEGVSHDQRGRPIDRRRYVLDTDGSPTFSTQRDQQYTRELADAIVAEFRRCTVLRPINVVAAAVFDLLKAKNPGLDLFRLLRHGGREPQLDLREVYRRLEEKLSLLRASEQRGQLRLDDTLKSADPVAVMAEALSHLSAYHSRPALLRRGDRLEHQQRNLLLYYGNRLSGLMDREG